MSEIWRDIAGYDGLYQVSNLGRVRRLHKHTPPRISKALPNRGGYLCVALCRGNKSKTCTIHRLVAMAFVSNPDNKPEVNHINGIKTDNRAENLEWCTRSENTRHALTTGLMTQGEERYNAKLTAAQVVYIRENPDGLTGAKLADMFGVTATAVSYVQSGKTYRNAGGRVREAKPHISRVPDDIRAEIRQLYVYGSRKFGSYALAKKYGITSTAILKIVNEN